MYNVGSKSIVLNGSNILIQEIIEIIVPFLITTCRVPKENVAGQIVIETVINTYYTKKSPLTLTFNYLFVIDITYNI